MTSEEMYNQRRYGGSSSVKPSTPGRGGQDSRQSKSGSIRGSRSSGSGPSRSNSSTPSNKPQEQPKKDLPVKKEPQNPKTEQMASNPKRNEGRPTSGAGK